MLCVDILKQLSSQDDGKVGKRGLGISSRLGRETVATKKDGDLWPNNTPTKRPPSGLGLTIFYYLITPLTIKILSVNSCLG
jgi:hypothetical protein